MKYHHMVSIVCLTGLMTGSLMAGQDMPQRKLLMAKEVTLPINQITAKVIRIEFPPRFRTPEHIHKGPGPRYVLQGKIRIIDQEGTHLYGPGEVFWESGEPMVAENASEGATTLLIFEMTPQSSLKRPSSGKIKIRPQ